jgi:hypothetical protein
MKDLMMSVVVHDMAGAARRQGVAPGWVYFADAVYWVQGARPGDETPRRQVNLARPGWVDPRVRKRRPNHYSVMTRPRGDL